jgi:hypothetical protein
MAIVRVLLVLDVVGRRALPDRSSASLLVRTMWVFKFAWGMTESGDSVGPRMLGLKGKGGVGRDEKQN